MRTMSRALDEGLTLKWIPGDLARGLEEECSQSRLVQGCDYGQREAWGEKGNLPPGSCFRWVFIGLNYTRVSVC